MRTIKFIITKEKFSKLSFPNKTTFLASINDDVVGIYITGKNETITNFERENKIEATVIYGDGFESSYGK